jgi:hypothetical protein
VREKRNAYRFLVGKSEGKKNHEEDVFVDGEDNIKMDLTWYVLDRFVSG